MHPDTQQAECPKPDYSGLDSQLLADMVYPYGLDWADALLSAGVFTQFEYDWISRLRQNRQNRRD